MSDSNWCPSVYVVQSNHPHTHEVVLTERYECQGLVGHDGPHFHQPRQDRMRTVEWVG